MILSNKKHRLELNLSEPSAFQLKYIVKETARRGIEPLFPP